MRRVKALNIPYKNMEFKFFNKYIYKKNSLHGKRCVGHFYVVRFDNFSLNKCKYIFFITPLTL